MTNPPRRRSGPLVIAIVTAIALLATGCGKSDDAPAAKQVKSSEPRSRTTPADAAAGGKFARTVAQRLYPFLSQQARGDNVVFSPTSLALALAMLRSGTGGYSGSQLDGFFVTLDAKGLHRAMNGLSAALESRTKKTKDARGNIVDVAVATADSLWGQSGIEWDATFLDLLHREYGVGVLETDFENEPDTARDQINDWVADRTEDEITDLLDAGAIGADTRLALVDALYLSAPWNTPFEEVGPRSFTNADGAKVKPEMLARTLTTTYRRAGTWQSVTIPYAGDDLSMTLVIPDAGKIGEVESTIDANLIDLWAGEDTKSPKQVRLTMPAFDITSKPSVTGALKAAGLTDPFETDKDFAPMSKDPKAKGLRLGSVMHQATVEVDANGTTAAAASAAVTDAGSAPSKDDVVTLTVDRPFLFLISDAGTHAPLFIGRIADPTAP